MVVVRVLVDVVDVDDVLAGGGAPVELDLPSRGENRIQIIYKKSYSLWEKQQQTAAEIQFSSSFIHALQRNLSPPSLPGSNHNEISS